MVIIFSVKVLATVSLFDQWNHFRKSNNHSYSFKLWAGAGLVSIGALVRVPVSFYSVWSTPEVIRVGGRTDAFVSLCIYTRLKRGECEVWGCEGQNTEIQFLNLTYKSNISSPAGQYTAHNKINDQTWLCVSE